MIKLNIEIFLPLTPEERDLHFRYLLVKAP